MEITIWPVIYLGCGGYSLYAYIRALLATELGEYGPAINSIEIYVRLLNPTRNPAQTPSEVFDRWHDGLKKLPLVTFRRQLKRIEIAFVSRHFNATDYGDGGSEKTWRTTWNPTPERYSLAAAEIAESLRLMKKRIKRTDDFDVERFLKDADSILSRKILTQDEWESILTVARRLEAEARAKKGPWELLDIDWSRFHPQAKELLDDPFYWDCLDDWAPHGNDTGADVLEEFRHWNKRHRSEPPFGFLEVLLSRCLGKIDASINDEEDVHNLLDSQTGFAAEVCDEAMIALPFAVIKLRASCPLGIVRLGLEALDRKERAMRGKIVRAGDEASTYDPFAKIRSKLQHFLH